MWYSRVVTISAGQLNNFGNRFEAGKLYYFNMSSSGAGSMVYSPTRSIGGVKWATGSSMRPTICNLDVVEICPVERGAIRRYHVVLAQLADGRYVIHRVVRVVVIGNQKCSIFGNLACSNFGNSPYTIFGNKSAATVRQI